MLPLPPIERILELLAFEEASGTFRWRRSLNARAREGAVAGRLNRGYRQIMIDGHNYRASRLAFKVANGRDPVGEIDHKNGQKSDDRPFNLREASHAQNNQNVPARRTNKLGLKGVCSRKDNKTNPFAAFIASDGVRHHLGYFPTAQEAHSAYQRAAIDLHGRFAHACFDSSAPTIQGQPAAAVLPGV